MSVTSTSPDVRTSFRETMAGVATPVSVITTLSEGLPHGTTVSAFLSLSMDPPMVLVSLDRTSQLLDRVRRTRRFAVNLLAHDQSGLATRFAQKGGPAKFLGLSWANEHGAPRLPGTGFVGCRLADVVDGGDHVLLLGDVLAAYPAPAAPLTYHRRAFGTHIGLDAS